ncbi:MAG: methyltransferase domain-containing protein [Dehalococcoidia bacterium]|nr:methyltransferase domain-containing protein [Dehalococcoidia bacterium]
MARLLPATALDVVFVSLGVLAPWVSGSKCWRRQARWRYRRLAPQYDREVIATTPRYNAALETALSRLSPPFERILDVSTGTGAVALAVARRFPDAVVCACDLSPEMLRVAQQNAAASGAHIAWQQADGARLPYHDAVFDLVFLQNAPPAFGELARVVKPRGMVVLCYTKGGALPGVHEYESIPAAVPDRCRADRGCAQCAQRCPRGALAVVDGTVELDRSACTRCGICVTACPHEAMELPGAMPAQVEAQVAALLHAAPAALGPRGIVFTCQHDGQHHGGTRAASARAATAQAPGWLPVEVPCVAMVPPTWVLAALAMGAASVALLPAPDGCPDGTADAVAGRVAYCRALLRALGEPDERVVCGYAVRSDGQREELRALGEPDERVAALPAPGPWPHALSDAPPPPPPRPHLSAPEVEAAFAHHARARVLAHLLARHARMDVGAVAHPHSPFGLVTAAPGCTLCGACAAACPAGALLLQHDATGATLHFAAARCTACGLCLPACPEPGVLALARITDLQRLCSGPVVLARSAHRRCAACGAPFAVEAMAAKVAALLGEASTAARLVARLCPACRPVAIGFPPDGPVVQSAS